ncbi:MAG TPA: hypothetical protein VMX16_06140 [Terriglobia bacterium]|nr:hypothetical protein [Terriglobia bacterium]
MPETNAQAISTGRWPEEAEKIAARPDGLARKLRVAWCYLLRVTFAGAVFYPFYSTPQQLLRWVPLPCGGNFFFFLIGVAGFVVYALLWWVTSDQDGWLISVGIPVGLSLIAGLVRAWISV